MPLVQGQVLKDRYRIVRLLGQGGFGAVYRAWDTSLNAPCALKENYDTSPEAVRQFAKEASLLANLRHPNLPKVMDHFSLPGQGQYLVMEYIEGEDLQQMLDRTGGPLSEVQALQWIGQVCDALSYMHSRMQPIIHRDLKPANIRITPEGQALLVDFGIAKVYDPVKRTSTAARAVTPGYAPFEQYGQKSTDARSDIYALGATLYHLLTGQRPPDSVDRIPRDCLLAPRQINPAISVQAEAAILKALQIDPERRWQSAAEFKNNLSQQPAAFSRPQPGLGNLHPAVSSPPPARQAPVMPASAQAPRRAPQSAVFWKWLAGGGTLALVILGVIGIIWVVSVLKPVATPLAALQTEEAEKPTERPMRTPSPTDNPAGLPGMVLIPAGEFQMGSEAGDSDEQPVHTVYLDAYFIDAYEVTNALFKEFVDATGHQTTAEKEGGGYAFVGDSWDYVEGADWRHPQGPSSSLDGLEQHPVVQVSWEDARAYCQWRGGDLPTEAQWEKAARGGLEGRAYPWGDEEPVCQMGASNGAHFWDCMPHEPVAVGSFSPNGYGLYDMAGNVWEWVLDWYAESYYSSQSTWRNPFGPASGDYRVLRGGSWYDGTWSLRTADRYRSVPTYRSYSTGLRCVRSP